MLGTISPNWENSNPTTHYTMTPIWMNFDTRNWGLQDVVKLCHPWTGSTSLYPWKSLTGGQWPSEYCKKKTSHEQPLEAPLKKRNLAATKDWDIGDCCKIPPPPPLVQLAGQSAAVWWKETQIKKSIEFCNLLHWHTVQPFKSYPNLIFQFADLLIWFRNFSCCNTYVYWVEKPCSVVIKS